MRAELEIELAEQFPFMRKKESLQEQMENGGISDLYSPSEPPAGSGPQTPRLGLGLTDLWL